MGKVLKITFFVCILMSFAYQAGCMGPSVDKVVEKFIEKCQTGDWTGAEGLLSERCKMGFEQTKSLEDTYWPMLGMAYKTGVNVDIIHQQMPEAAKIVASDSSTARGQVRVNIKNSLLMGDDRASSIKRTTGLKSIDVLIKIDVVQEMNRWRIERITPMNLSDEDKRKWKDLAGKTPGSLGL